MTDIDTSVQALDATEPRLNKAHTEILRLLECHKAIGLTADEAAGHLFYAPLFIRPRFTELHKMKKIEKTGTRRKNKSGMSANAWRIAA